MKKTAWAVLALILIALALPALADGVLVTKDGKRFTVQGDVHIENNRLVFETADGEERLKLREVDMDATDPKVARQVRDEISRIVEEALEAVDVEAIVHDALKAVESVDVEAIVSEAMRSVEAADVERRVAEALEAADIEGIVQEAIHASDVRETVAEAMKAVEAAEVDVEAAVAEAMKALEDADVKGQVAEAMKALEDAGIDDAVADAMEAAEDAVRQSDVAEIVSDAIEQSMAGLGAVFEVVEELSGEMEALEERFDMETIPGIQAAGAEMQKIAHRMRERAAGEKAQAREILESVARELEEAAQLARDKPEEAIRRHKREK